jgi:hypothetical protein
MKLKIELVFNAPKVLNPEEVLTIMRKVRERLADIVGVSEIQIVRSTTPCPVCRSVGMRFTDEAPMGWILCERCSGEGRVPE